MPDSVLELASGRIAEHVRRHRLTSVRVIFHGGEPLLVGAARLTAMAAVIRGELPLDCRVEFAAQTNGTLLDEDTLERLRAHHVRVGVSWDGASQDRYRRHHDGRSSSREVHEALRLLAQPRFREVYAGILCAVDVTADPVECLEAMIAHRPPAVDLLLPHANWNRPPPHASADAAYGRWLIGAFDRWYDADPMETRVRLFEDVIAGHLGYASRSEQVGLSPIAAAVIESDGSIELIDSLRSAYPGASQAGLHLSTSSLDDLLDHPGMIARRLGFRGLCGRCQRCEHGRICGGGHYAHRYREGSGFANPSVYCADMALLSEHVGRRVTADLSRLTPRTGS